MNAKYRNSLPQLQEALSLSDGGLETEVTFHYGRELPNLDAFTLVGDEEGRGILDSYYRSYIDVARDLGVGIVLETPTFRSNPGWGAACGFGDAELAEFNRAAIAFLLGLRQDAEAGPDPVRHLVISGQIGPSNSGYDPDLLHAYDHEAALSPSEAEEYHDAQVRAFADAGADLVSGITFAYVDEAVGLIRAARNHGMPVVCSFTLETDGRLPDGTSLLEAIRQTDGATDGYASYYMVNCAHPEHLARVLDSEGSEDHALPEEEARALQRIGGLKLNASTRSKYELHLADDLDEGDPASFARGYCAQVERVFTAVRVMGGCCGTDARHIRELGMERREAGVF